jgi:WD40 repeat protein
MAETVAINAPPSIDLPDTPYVGLTPFTERDAPFFFGREKERRIIAANLMASRLTLLYGASGVGKSSILRAGVAWDVNERARLDVAKGRLPEWIPLVFSAWRDDPIAGIAGCIGASVHALLGDTIEPVPPMHRLDELAAEWLRRLDERAAAMAKEQSLEPDELPRTQLLVILDQFEQYFLYYGDEDGQGTFAVEFPRAVNRQDMRVNFLISLREDAYTQLDRFEGRILNLFESNLRIEHLDRAAARAAIEKPIEAYSRLLGPGAQPYAIEPELVEAVLDDVKAGSIGFGAGGDSLVGQSEPEGDRVETPFLQLVMTRLWEEERDRGSRVLRLQTLKDLGGAGQIVRAHLEEAIDALTPDERALAARVFHQLVAPSGTKITHKASDLAGYAEVPEETLLPILEKLDAQRILRSVDPAPGDSSPRFEIRHDVLAGAVLEWSRQYEEKRRQAEVEATQRKKLEAERRKRRTASVFGIAVSLGLVAVAVLAVLFFRAQDDAKTQRDIARSREIAARAILELPDDPQESIKLALAAQRASQTREAEGALRSALTEAPRRLIGPPGLPPGRSAAFSPDGRLVVTAGGGTARIWDIASGVQVRVLPGRGNINGAAFSPDGKLVVTASDDGTARIWNVASGKELRALRGHTDAVKSAAFSPDGKLVVTASADGTARIWNAETGTQVRPLQAHTRAVNTAAFSPDGTLVVTASDDGTARISDRATGLSVPLYHDDHVTSASFSPDGWFVVTTSGDTAQVWMSGSGRKVATLRGHTRVNSAAFSPDGRLIVTASDDGRLRVWQAPGRTAQPVPGETNAASGVSSAAFSPDGRLVATSSPDGAIRLWNPVTRGNVVFRRDFQPAWRASFSADGRFLVTTDGDTALIWETTLTRETASKRLKRVLQGPAGIAVDSAAFSPDGTLVVTASADGTARIWNAETGKKVRSLQGHGGVLNSAAFSPDGTLVVTASADGTARIWNAEAGTQVRSLQGHTGAVNSAAFSPDGTLVVTASDDGTARIWDAADGRLQTVLTGHDARVNSVAFSPDSEGKFVVTASDDGTARIWDAAAGVTLALLYGHTGSVYTAAFSPDDTTVVTAGADGTVRFYACDVCRPVPHKPGPDGSWNWPPPASPATRPDASTRGPTR